MVCRMFDESNGRSNFDVATVGIDPVYAMPVSTSASAKEDPSIGRCNHPPPPVLPHEDTVLAMLRREKWLRLRPQVQDAVSWPGMNGTRMNALIQVRVAREFGFTKTEGLQLIRQAPLLYGVGVADDGNHNDDHNGAAKRGAIADEEEKQSDEREQKVQLMAQVPHYRVFNRSRRGSHLTVGARAPEVQLALLPLFWRSVRENLPSSSSSSSSLLASQKRFLISDFAAAAGRAGRVLVVVAGSIT